MSSGCRRPTDSRIASVSSATRMTTSCSRSLAEIGLTVTRRFAWASTRPSLWSIRSASRSGVRLTPRSSASATCDITAPGASSPSRIASRTRR
jgi:hypothetical protein